MILTPKADKVTDAENGNLAALDAEGNLKDSGKKATDFATSEQGTKADNAAKQTDFTNHVNNKENPHCITVEQIGAATAAQGEKADNIDTEISSARASYTNLKERLDAQDDSIEALQNAALPHRYGILWDKVNAKCTRLYDAVGMTANAYKGTYNADLKNDFDDCYPWRDRILCNVDLDEYKRIHAAGGDIKDSIISWDGDVDFALDGSNGFVGVYTPEFWVRQEETSSGVEIIVADKELLGYIHFPSTIGGRYFACSDGDGGITSRAGTFPLSANLEGTSYTLGT